MIDLDELIAEARRLEGDYSDNHEVVTHMSVLADALEAAARVPVQGEPECECWPTEEKYHFVHFGATEPGSAIEFNPECPQHGETLEKIVSDYAAALYTMEETVERLSRATVPDAATEELRADKMTAEEAIESVLKRPGMYGLVPKNEHRSMKAERDAALAAIERVRAVVKSIRFLAALPPFDEGNTVMNATADDIVAALDGKEKNDE